MAQEIASYVNGGVSFSGVAASGMDLCEGLGVGGVVLYSRDKPRVGKPRSWHNVSFMTCIGGGACVVGAFAVPPL